MNSRIICCEVSTVSSIHLGGCFGRGWAVYSFRQRFQRAFIIREGGGRSRLLCSECSVSRAAGLCRGKKNIARLDPDRDANEREKAKKVLLESLAKPRPSLAFSSFLSSLSPGTYDRNLDILPEGLWNVVLFRTFQVSFTFSSAIYLIVLSRKP